TRLEQEAGRVVPALLLVGDDARRAPGEIARIERDGAGLEGRARHLELAVIHRRVEDPAHLVGEHGLDRGGLEGGIAAGVDRHEGVALPQARSWAPLIICPEKGEVATSSPTRPMISATPVFRVFAWRFRRKPRASAASRIRSAVRSEARPA